MQTAARMEVSDKAWYNGTKESEYVVKTIAVTMGDPCGIGPEIVLKAAADPNVSGLCRILIVGNPEILRLRLRRSSKETRR